jgi:hypothetical protein
VAGDVGSSGGLSCTGLVKDGSGKDDGGRTGCDNAARGQAEIQAGVCLRIEALICIIERLQEIVGPEGDLIE